MEELRELYQQIILEHYRNPRNFGELSEATHRAEGNNPLCGDRLTVELRVLGDRIEDIRFRGSGCAISQASASVMTTLVKGVTVEEAEALFERFHRIVLGETEPEALDLLAAFAGVREFPSRVKCATLAWHTLRAALHNVAEVVTTE
ncbi:Zinc-dependent sulfurtransferase SufU [bacterium HR21]|jgi:nitrogen fixation NifU-like protein|nr:Zinc-dependent sulfurtransferase SufU [bacterium HR21]